MSDQQKHPIGSIGWTDLTVDDATGVRDFYAQVVGWKHQGLSMGDYEDYCMDEPGSGKTVAGICHRRGTNANIPPAWLVYITVADADAAAKKVVELGGEIMDGPRKMGGGRFCVIRDPAGAVCALISA